MLHGQVSADICCPIALLSSMVLDPFHPPWKAPLSLVGFTLLDVAPSTELCPSLAQLKDHLMTSPSRSALLSNFPLLQRYPISQLWLQRFLD